MKIDPCCGLSLRTGVKLIALISLIWTLILIVVEVILLFSGGLKGVAVLNPEIIEDDVTGHGLNKTLKNVQAKTSAQTKAIFSVPLEDIAISFAWIVSWIVDIAFSILLFLGAKYKNSLMCLIWFYYRCVALVFRVIFIIIYIVAGFSLLTKIPLICLLLFRVYSLWVVSKFISQLKAEKATMASIPTVVVSYDEKRNSEGGGDAGVENPMYKN